MEELGQKPAILSLDPNSLEDVLSDIIRVGQATNAQEVAEGVVAKLRERVDAVKQKAALAGTRPRVACLEWIEPTLCAGHWVPEMVEQAGGEDCLGDKSKPSFRVDWKTVLDQHPDIVLVAPCGFDVKRGLQDVGLLAEKEGWGSLPAVQKGQVFVIDASAYISRSGPRLVDGLEMIAEIIHPELFSGMVPQGGVARLYSPASVT